MVLRDPVSTEERLYTVKEFWAFIDRPENADRKFELINGVIVEDMSPGLKHGIVVLNLGAEVRTFLKQNPIGVIASDVDLYLPLDDYNTRRPDLEFISHDRLKLIEDHTRPIPLMPDLVVEVKSPGNTYEELRQKAAYYLKNGARMVWLVYPEKEQIVIYTAGVAEPKIYRKGDTLSGGDVLPGFSLALSEVFAM
jgi:Uma2 family endonuclease